MAGDRIIMGIDPGTNLMGYGVIKIENRQVTCLALGFIDLRKVGDHYLKLDRIYKRVISIIEEFLPDELAIEAPFFGKNVQSMLKLGRAQGVAMAAAISRDIPIFEYAPRKIKLAITGQGAASKEQVAAMVKSYLKITDVVEQLDATDGIAAALCHYFQGEKSVAKSSYSGWADFADKNKRRVVK